MGWKNFKIRILTLIVGLQGSLVHAITFDEKSFDPSFPIGLGARGVPTLYQCAGGNVAAIFKNTAGSKDLRGPACGASSDDDDDEDDDRPSNFSQSFMAGFGAPCPEVGVFEKRISCENITSGGAVVGSRVKDTQARACDAFNAMNCKERRLTAVEAELENCVKPQISQITQMMEGIQANCENELAQSKQQIAKLKSWEGDRVAQEEELKGILEGTSTSPGLLRTKDMHLKMIDQLSQDKLVIKNAWETVRVERNKMKEFRQIREASLMADCFNSRVVSSDHKCSAGETAVSPREVLTCRFQQNARLGENGQINQDGLSKRQALVAVGSLEQLMQKIFGDTPNKGRLPSNVQEGPEFVNQAIDTLNPDEIDRKYGSQLKGLSANGIDVYAFTMANLRACYARGQGTVVREMGRDNTQLGQMRLSIKRVERESQSVIERALTKYQDHYGDVVRALKVGGGLNVDACRVDREEVQNGCFEDIKAKFDALMFTAAIPPIMIRSGNPSGRPETSINSITGEQGGALTCAGRYAGLQNCIRKIEGVREVVQRDISSIRQKKQETVDNTNTNIKKSFATLASNFSRLTRQSVDVMEKLKGALSNLGVSGVSVNNTSMATASLSPNQDGLLEIPDGANAMQVINGMMDPKLPDLNGGMFDGVLSAVSRERGKLATSKSDAYNAITRMVEDAKACQKIKVDALVAKAERDIADLKAKCEYVKENCGPPKNDKLEELQEDLAKISSDLGDDVTGTLQSGLNGLCTEKSGLEAEIEEKKREVAEADATYREKKAATSTTQTVDNNTEMAYLFQDYLGKKSELTALQTRMKTGEKIGSDCASIRTRIGKSIKGLQQMDKAGRSLAGEAE